MNEVLLKQVRSFPRTTRELIMSCDGDEYIDAIAEIRRVEKSIAGQRSRHAKEASNGDHGKMWRIVIGRKAIRSFNSMSLLTKFADALDKSLLETIGYLMNNKVLTLEWGWSKLKKEANYLNVDLTIAHHEITDGDSADVGEIWIDNYPSYEKLTPEDTDAIES